MMTRTRMTVSLALLLSTAAACTFEGALQDQFYHPTIQTVGGIPLKIGVIVDEKEQGMSHLRTMDPNFKYYVKVQPGLPNAVAAELATVFREVVIVQNDKQAGDANLLAYVSFDASETATWVFNCRIDLRFYDPQTKQIVTTFQRSEAVNVGASGTSVLGLVLTGLTVGLGAPIFIPMMVNSQGERMVEALEAQLPGIIRRMTGEISSEPRMLAFASGMRPGQLDVGLAHKAPVIQLGVDQVPTSGSPKKKHAYAVVIGIEQYREKLPKADFADRDAKLVGEYLTKVMGYPEENVIVQVNDRATGRDLEKYFESWLPNNVEKDGSVFVYYSGHGSPSAKSGDAYLVPYDGDPAFLETTGYPLKRLYAALEKLPAGEVTVVLDSCFSGAGGRSVIAQGLRPMGLSVEKAMKASGKTIVLSASSGEQVSSTYLDQGHGLMTYFFLKGLQGDGDTNHDGIIELAELFEYVKPNVQRIARKQYNNEQIPQLLATPEALSKRGGRLVERVKP